MRRDPLPCTSLSPLWSTRHLRMPAVIYRRSPIHISPVDYGKYYLSMTIP
nr:MAG TPA: hypothetical protein [Caudoviricetes sp.]